MESEIATLRADLAKAREEIAERADTEKSLTEMVVEVQRARDEAVAEVARLKEALSQVLDDETGDYDFIKWTARRALGRTDGEGA